MKAVKRKLLSLILAMAMVLTLAPTALADTTENSSGSNYTASISVESVEEGGSAVEGQTDTYTSGSKLHLKVALNKTVPDGTSVSYSWNQATGDTTNKDKATLTLSAETTVTCMITIGSAPNTETVTANHTYKVGTASSGTATVKSISISTSSTTIEAGSGERTITATVTDTEDKPMNGQTVTWYVTAADGAITTGNSTTQTLKITPAPSIAKKTDVTIYASIGKVNSEFLIISVVPASTTLPTFTIGTSASNMSGNGQITLTIPSTAPDFDSVAWVITSGGTYASLDSQSTTLGSNTLIGSKTALSGTVYIKATLSKGGKEVATGTTSVTVNATDTGIVSIYLVNGSGFNTYNNTFSGYGSYLTAYARVNGTAVDADDYDYVWTHSDNHYDSYYYNDVVSISSSSSPSITVTARNNGYSRITLTVYNHGYTHNEANRVGTAYVDVYVGTGYSTGYLASVNVTNSYSYSLGSRDDLNGSSIVSQLSSLYYTAGYYTPYAVQFTGSTSHTYGSLNANTYTTYYLNSSYSNYLGNVVFTPSGSAGRATFSVRVFFNNTNSHYVDGTISFDTSGTVYNAGDITYSAAIGADVPFYLKDFEDYYYNRTHGTLSYVTFTIPSSGTLYADGGRLSSGNACYASPNSAQTDLAGVYFSPSGTTATRANTVRINFTAYGTQYSYGASSVGGTVVITYLAGSASNITYYINTSGSLNPSDFVNAYRQVVGSAAPAGLTIQLQSAPTYGTLTYKDSSRSGSTAVNLSSANIRSYRFTTLSSGTNQLGDVTYTASGSRTDTIEYTAYVNSTPQFTGKIVFNGSNTSASNMQVGFTSTNGQGVAFSYAEFSKANAGVIAMTSYIRFVTMPTNGTLTYGGAVMGLSSTNVPPAMLGSVVYRPNAGFNNSTDRVSFLCYDANGNSVGGGQVSIVVTGNGSSGVISVSQFKDVSTKAWYRDDLSRLLNAGIIKGKGDGQFDPTGQLTYGEALKIFLLASGYPAQAETTGKNWAINYKNVAVSNGWISQNVDLSAKISRNSMAELTAKALGVSATDSVPPTWRDGTSNGYSNALYYTDPQILIGNGDGTFKGTSTLLRQEICAIAVRVLNYRSTHLSNTTPGWIG